MKLLMITRKVDAHDALAGFTYSWVKKMGELLQAQSVSAKLFVVCLEEGETEGLPACVEVYSLGKESGVNRTGRFWDFQRLALKLVPQVDGIFCHMNPEYTINIFPYAKLYNKKIVSWYTHGAVTWKLRLLEKMANVIMTASAESFRLPSSKLVVTGHGIDTEVFVPPAQSRNNLVTTLLTVGRISPTKNLFTMVDALGVLKGSGKSDALLQIVGAPGLSSQQKYFEKLKQTVFAKNLENAVEFVGPVPNNKVIGHYQSADIFINLSDTGSVDKAVLEAMACECIVLTSNRAFHNILPPQLIVPNEPTALAQKISDVIHLAPEERQTLQKKLRQIVVAGHNLDTLLQKIISQFV